MLDEFKKFLLRGNVIDLAVAVVIGVAFKAVVDAFVLGVITPLIGLIGGQDFSTLTITLKEATKTKEAVVLSYGAVLTQALNFVLIAAAIFFLVVKPLNVLAERHKRGQDAEDDVPPTEAELLIEIRDLLQAQQTK